VKICLIIDDYLPNSIKAGAKMMHDLGVEFVRQGHTVTVITPEPGLHERLQICELDGVTVCRFKSGKIKNVSQVKRALNETLLSRNAWKALRGRLQEDTHDLIVYYSPTIFWGPLVNKLKKSWGCPSYLILRDLFPQWAVDKGLLREASPITKFFRFFERLSYRAADLIALQSPKNLQWFEQMVQTEKPLDLLYNWAANEPVTNNSEHYRQELGLVGKVVYIYGGTFGHPQDTMNLVRLAKNMLDVENAHFVLIGEGDEVDLVRAAIAREGLTNTTLLPPVLQDEFKSMLAEFDIGLFTLHRGHTTHSFPGKLLSYMLAEMPILGSINQDNDLKSVVEGANAGLITVNGDDQGLLANALKLLENETLRQQMGKNAKQLLDTTFSVKGAADHILNSGVVKAR
jgi:glycosyltransferase involved in cell wall biosynthesis